MLDHIITYGITTWGGERATPVNLVANTQRAGRLADAWHPVTLIAPTHFLRDPPLLYVHGKTSRAHKQNQKIGQGDLAPQGQQRCQTANVVQH